MDYMPTTIGMAFYGIMSEDMFHYDFCIIKDGNSLTFQPSDEIVDEKLMNSIKSIAGEGIIGCQKYIKRKIRMYDGK